jgi:hypothetical protein
MPKEIETGSDKTAIRPFHVNVPEAELTDLRRRINATRWPEQETVKDTSQDALSFSPNEWRALADRRAIDILQDESER